jgi:hypothetical protein
MEFLEKYRQLYRAHMAGLGAVSKEIAAGFLSRAWEAVNIEMLDQACSIYEDFNESEHWNTKKKWLFMIHLMIFILFGFCFDVFGFSL